MSHYIHRLIRSGGKWLRNLARRDGIRPRTREILRPEGHVHPTVRIGCRPRHIQARAPREQPRKFPHVPPDLGRGRITGGRAAQIVVGIAIGQK